VAPRGDGAPPNKPVIAGLIAVALIDVLSPTDSGIVGGLKAFFDGVGETVGRLAPTAN
ncbi:hypothetical protein AAIH33_34030, partial [Pseudomonas aeruginosa]